MSLFGGRKQEPHTPGPSDFPPPRLATSRQPLGFETVLGSSATLRGDLKSQGNIRLDGTFEGTLQIDGNVLVGETGKITADINAKNVSIAGAVRGNVSGKKVQLLRTARVWGDISASSISTEEGAFIEGKITMLSHEVAQDFDPAELPLPDLTELAEQPDHNGESSDDSPD
jgi:cytoskeletal protein CcmA (bactofilin family)